MKTFLNRQKLMMLAATGVLMLTASCSQDIENLGTDGTSGENTSSEVRLQFATGPATRGTMYDKTDVMPCLLYTSPSPRDRQKARMPSSA